MQFGTSKTNFWKSLGALTLGAACAMPGNLLGADNPQLTKALSYSPEQPEVNYEKVKPEDIAECSIEEATRGEAKGFLVSGPSGQPLRWYADTNADNRLDQWSYYNNGVEVYREIDSNANGKADQYRWLNTEGMRWGIDKNEDKVIDVWKSISPEEVSAEVVKAASTRDAARFARLLISENEIAEIGLGNDKATEIRQLSKDASQQFESWAEGQNVVGRQSKWMNFGADKPGTVPSGTEGSSKDVVVYENVVALLEEAGKPKQLMIGTIIKVNEAWRLVELPKAVNEGAVISDAGRFFTTSFQPRGGAAPAEAAGGLNKAMQNLVEDLQATDDKLQASGTSAEEKATLQALRANVLERLVSASTTDVDRSTWIKQFADTVSAASQSGEFPKGIDRMKDFARKLSDAKVSSEDMAYVEYRAITAENNFEMNKPGANFEKLQKEHLTSLATFVDKYPASADSAEAMIQIALSAEFSGDVANAEKWYQRAKADFGDTLPGKKGAGALNRLNLIGTKFGLKGTTIEGANFSADAYLGGPVIYHCWASWCDGCKAEMRALKELQSKYAKNKLHIVGLNFDNAKTTGTEFLKQNSFPWVHLFEEGGLDSNIAIRYGILTLPVNIIVDKSGTVVKTGVHWSELDGIVEELSK